MKGILLSFAILLSAQAAVAQETQPLAGKIWQVETSEFVAFPAMLNIVKDKTYLVVGERHGRHAHQGREAFLIGALAEAGRYPSIVLEMLSHAQSEKVIAYRKEAPEYALGLGLELDWANSNWPSWNYYQPVFDAAFTTKAPIVGADLTNAEQEAVLAASNVTDIGPSYVFYKEHMTKAHCGLIEEKRADALARLQQARDQKMADQLKSAVKSEQGAVLIVGSSHIPKSTGIPKYLPAVDTAVILLRETDATTSDFRKDQAQAVSHNAVEYDFIWFTPKIEQSSLCDRLDQQQE